MITMFVCFIYNKNNQIKQKLLQDIYPLKSKQIKMETAVPKTYSKSENSNSSFATQYVVFPIYQHDEVAQVKKIKAN